MGATNSAQIYRIPIVQLETIPVDQSSLGGVVAYFNNLGEKLYAELGNHSNQSDLNWEEHYSEANRLPKNLIAVVHERLVCASESLR